MKIGKVITKRTINAIAATLTVIVFLLPLAAAAQLAQSNFDADTEGWLSVTLPYPHPTPINILATNVPIWQPGGLIQIQDPDGSGSVGNVQYWLAPSKFLGAKAAAYGGRLSFDLRNQGTGSGTFTQEDVILAGNGLTLVYQLTNSPAENVFTHYVVPFTATDWKRDSLDGPNATPLELQMALSAVSYLFIRAEYQLGPDTEFLDNVLLCSGAALTISAAGTNVVLSWPQTACGAFLERSDSAGSAANWIADGSSPAVVGSQFVVTNQMIGKSRFYRLSFP